jgi:DNA-binding NtrC family response regulator
MISNIHHPTILIVEDEFLVRRVSADQLEEDGYCVLEAETAADAIRILESEAGVAVMFTDVNMPGDLDGLGLARLVHERWPAVRLLVTSGGGKVSAHDVPDDGRFMPKPYTMSRMTQLVGELAGPPY